MPNHIVSSYDTELENLRRSISEMGGIAEKMMTDSGNALVRRDVPLAQAVIAADKRLDAIQHEVEERAILLIAKRQPLSIDLRETVSAIRVSNDLERIGDLSKNVAKRVVAIADQIQPQKIVIGVQHMGDLVQEQLKDVLDAYGSQDVKAALDVWERDDSIDALYNSLFRELLTYMMEDPRNISFCIASDVLRQEHRADRRSHHQHRRDDPLSRHMHRRSSPSGTSARRTTRRTTPPCRCPPAPDRCPCRPLQHTLCAAVVSIRDGRHHPENIRMNARILVVEDEEALTHAAALQSRRRRLRRRDSAARGDEADTAPEGAGSRPRPARLDDARPVRHRAVPPHPGAAGDQAAAGHHAHRARRGGRA